MRWLPSFVICVALIALAPGRARAQDPDFLFGSPKGSIGIRGGLFLPTSNGDLYDFTRELLTIDKNDLNAPAFGFDLGWTLNPRVDVVFGVDVTKSRASSEYVNFVDQDDLPIEQQTNVTGVPVNASLKLYLTPRGREVSRFAYIPNKVNAYVGGGGGPIWYKFEQLGDFIDCGDPAGEFFDCAGGDIFSALFESKGWGLQAHAFAGVDIRLARRVYLGIEGRYLWADAGVGGDFEGFDSIDLGGLTVTGGISYVF